MIKWAFYDTLKLTAQGMWAFLLRRHTLQDQKNQRRQASYRNKTRRTLEQESPTISEPRSNIIKGHSQLRTLAYAVYVAEWGVAHRRKTALSSI